MIAHRASTAVHEALKANSEIQGLGDSTLPAVWGDE